MTACRVAKSPLASVCLVLVSACVWGCSEASVSAPEALRPTVSLQGLGDSGAVNQLGLGLAVALRQPAVRAWVRLQIDASPYVEHRIALRRVLRADASSRGFLLAAAGLAHAWPGLADALPELELYIPIRAQRQEWRAAQDIALLVLPDEQTGFVLYEPEGTARRVSSDYTPEGPTLLLAASEIDYDDLESAVEGGRRTGSGLLRGASAFELGLTTPQRQICLECGGGGGGGGGTPTVGDTTQTTHLVYFRITKDHDPARGSMELEIWGSISGQFKECQWFTGLEPNTDYLLSPSDISTRLSRAVPISPNRLFVDAWEDDWERCVLHTSGDLFHSADDELGHVSLYLSQYNTIWGTVLNGGAIGTINVKVTATPAN